MPTYDYLCKQCGIHFEARRGMDAPDPPCPDCGGGSGKVMLSPPAAHGHMARGREEAMRSLESAGAPHRHGPGCACCGGG